MVLPVQVGLMVLVAQLVHKVLPVQRVHKDRLVYKDLPVQLELLAHKDRPDRMEQGLR
jgi:hypothetical protein